MGQVLTGNVKRTYETHPHLVDECKCGGLKSKAAVQCRECFRILQIARKEGGLDWKRWVSEC